MIRAWVIDPSAFTPAYDHALCAALGRAGAEVTLVTSEFAYGETPPADAYARRDAFYRLTAGAPASQIRRAGKLLQHVPDMLALRRRLVRAADVAHFQWFGVQWVDRWLLPDMPRVLTAHDLLPREPRPGQTAGQRALLGRMDALITHSDFGRTQLVQRLGLEAQRVHVVPHGAFRHLAEQPHPLPLPAELRQTDPELPVVLFFGLLRPYKGLRTLLEAWRGITDAQLWIVGRPRMALEPLRQQAPSNVHFVPRYVSDRELPSVFGRAELVVLPYVRTDRFDQSGVLATALAFGVPAVVSAVGGLEEVAALGAAQTVPPDDAGALHQTLARLLGDDAARGRLAAAARAAARGPLSWEEVARRTLEVYRQAIGARRGA